MVLARHYFPLLDTKNMTEEELAELHADIRWLEKRERDRMASSIVYALNGG